MNLYGLEYEDTKNKQTKKKISFFKYENMRYFVNMNNSVSFHLTW